ALYGLGESEPRCGSQRCRRGRRAVNRREASLCGSHHSRDSSSRVRNRVQGARGRFDQHSGKRRPAGLAGSEMVTYRVLYYPHIALPPSPWLIQMLLYWDEVATITPYDFVQDPDRHEPFTRDLI